MKIGFIGAGNMGSAIIGGIIKNGISNDILVSDKNKDGLLTLSKKYDIKIAKDNIDAAKSADILFLAVKPNVIENVISEIKDAVSGETLIISIVAGKSIEYIENAFEKGVKVIRVMPNTPALVGEGMSALCKNNNVTLEDMKNALKIFEGLGEAEEVSENIMDAVTAVSGSAPAYIFMVIEAMADGAVAGGMPRTQAYKFAAQTVLGSAKMVLETGKHPADLKDMVCSPGGTTIEAVKVLEEKGLRCAIIEAISACMEKSKKL